MPTGRNANNTYALPADPVFLEIPHSDGDASTWPTNTKKNIQGGEVNYMQHVATDEGLAVKWRIGIGAALANALQKSKGPNYVLSDWPKNYRMFIHNKGPAANPRQDVYLFGSTRSPKFRSIPEFIPHAIWLVGGLKDACECKYCSKRKSQREITADMGERGIIEMSPGPSSSPSRPSLPKPRKPRPEGSSLRNQVAYAAIQKNKLNRLRAPSNFIAAGSYAPHEQVFDLQATHGRTALDLRRWYRNDELVWVELESPIIGSKEKGDIIKVWPAIVEESFTRSEGHRKESSDLPQNEASGFSTSTSSHHHIESSHPGYDPNFPPWTIAQYTKYKLKLLGTSCSYVARDDQVVPYQAYLPPSELIEALQDVPLSYIRIDNEYTSNFSPLSTQKPGEPPTPAPTFEECTGPYALAIQIGAQVAGFWSVSDAWDFKFSFKNDTPKPTQAMAPSYGMGLDAVISAASSSNAANLGPATTYGTTQISGNRQMSAEELDRIKAATLGTPKPVNQSFSQKNFQGLWWGAERIWTGDLLRLKLGRHAIAPEGAFHIAAPSPPGPATLMHNEGKVDAKHLGASSRGVFMRLDALFTVDVELGNGKKRSECRAAGPLYELADEDWEDPSGETPKSSPSKPPKIANGAPSGEYVDGRSNALPQPSPLQPAALPNPDPSVPVDQTASQINQQIHHPNSSVHPSDTTGNKAPAPTTHHELPEPPTGYKFRPILESDYEAVFSLTLLSGRYYPGILSHPLLSEAVTTAFTPEGEINPLSSHLWALEGLEAGIANSMDPIRYKKDRLKMLVDAENSAREQLREHLELTSKPDEKGIEAQPDGDVSMENSTKAEAMEVDQMIKDRDEMLVDP
ncbi:hypothetical protein GYMLUDRAFT_234563 [Collybiopsis luxurians FD-317 M1]|uniref:Cryptic loci regulator 2 N-terminal domain-containing protein n=1 Tax=Collybiopsis luxurians FD-317 M1 TaxID=944289 RepID=A0A0D0BMD3_9AGAR|nr:hypothetical protein GYMLUDRAFT_234563 [Collybiopsis luxurians FD-317 M1]